MLSTSSNLPTFQTWIHNLPPITLLTLCTLWIIHSIRLFTGYISNTNFALESEIHSLFSIYRLFTGAYLHADALHISLNSLALARVGPKLESSFGTVEYAFLQTICVIAASFTYVAILSIVRLIDDTNSWTHQSTVGFSACLFALFVIEVESAFEEAEPTNVFGRLLIPMRLMPWVMIVAIQFFIPNVSFTGHLAGALIGLLLSRGLGLFVLPSREIAAKLDSYLIPWFPRVLGSFRPVWARGTVSPFECSSQKAYNCCSFPSTASLLPLTTSTQGTHTTGAAAASNGPSFPATGGRKLGST
jgi:membrane associated rhomboid family serine protease